MKLTFKVLACSMLLLSAGLILAASDHDQDDAHGKPVLIPFSQGDNKARDYENVSHLQHLPAMTDWNWHLGLALEYNRSFDSDKLGSYFFPATNKLRVGPANVTGVDIRNTDAYFKLVNVLYCQVRFVSFSMSPDVPLATHYSLILFLSPHRSLMTIYNDCYEHGIATELTPSCTRALSGGTIRIADDRRSITKKYTDLELQEGITA